ncbi:hypothetical protein EDD22DRAFT_854598 [Suillus occidentalis]|nr:hypothetical protein EDD22DRAFT_854598 [Suillus occidentalis]
MSSVESNNTLSVAEVSLKSALVQIKIFQSDGWVVVDQAHDIARLVSQALQQHSRNVSVIPPLLLSAAAEVHATMNVGQAPQWERVTINDSHMESHPFFAKTKGYVAPPQAEVPTAGLSASLPAPKVMSVPPINSLVVEAAQLRTNKGKQPTQKTMKKRHKLTKRLSKAIISNANDDENGQPGGTIVVKPVVVVPETPAPSKKVKQTNTELRNGQPTTKGKAKAKATAVGIAEGDKMAALAQSSQTWSRAAPANRATSHSRVMRVASHAHQPTPMVESKDNMDDTNDADEDMKMSSVANMEQPVPIMSVNNFPAEHWQEDTDVTIPPPPVTEPTPSAPPPMPSTTPPMPLVTNPTPVIPDPTPLVADPTIHDHVVALAARVSAMELADQGTIARIDTMERKFDSHISSMWAEFSDVQLSFTTTVEVVETSVGAHGNQPIIPATSDGPSHWFLCHSNGYEVFDCVPQASVSCQFPHPDGQGSTFTSGQPSSESALARPSSAPAINSHFNVSSPASATHSLP